VVGIDIDPDMVATAQQYLSHPPKWAQSIRTDNLEFFCEDATRLTFPDCYFDAVFLFGVLHHIEGWEKAISEVYRTLKVGGVFSFVEETLLPDFSSPSGRLGFYVAKSYKLVGAVPISEGELKTVLEKNGSFIQRFEKLLSLCFVRATKDGGGREMSTSRQSNEEQV
jgi:SAM-dependent methyltransferase